MQASILPNRSQTASPRVAQAVLNPLTLMITLAANAAATVVPLGGRTTAEISDSLPALFVPAGYVFSIWGLIYLSLIGFAVFQALPNQQANPYVHRTGWWFVVSNLANTAWIFCWHYGWYALSVGVMIGLLVTLIGLYRALNAPTLPHPDRATRWLVQWPFSLYLGWICVATIANVAATLFAAGWDGAGLAPDGWTAVMITVAVALSLFISALYRDLTFNAVLVWALIGIALKQSAYPLVVGASGAACVAIVAGLGFFIWRARATGR